MSGVRRSASFRHREPGASSMRQRGSYVIAQRIADSLNPDKVGPKPSTVKTFADMTENERAKMRALYERKKG